MQQKITQSGYLIIDRLEQGITIHLNAWKWESNYAYIGSMGSEVREAEDLRHLQVTGNNELGDDLL